MLKPQALFINGIYEAVLREILQVQSLLPEQIMFLQPFKAQAMTLLQHNPPTVDTPLRLYISLTDDLAHVHYQAEVVGWDDKRSMPEGRRQVITNLIKCCSRTKSNPMTRLSIMPRTHQVAKA